MALDAGFVRGIEQPEHSVLDDALTEACNLTTQRLNQMGFSNPEPWLVRKVAFAYFYDWERDSPDFAFVLPDPGNLGKEYTQEVRDLRAAGPDIPILQQVSFYRDLAKDWFLNHRTDFPGEFFPVLQSMGIIDYSNSWREYIQSGEFFDDFYMTDVVKYRVAGGSTSSLEEWAFRRHLKQELSTISPTVIFVFGGRAWNTIRTHLTLESVGSILGDDSKITNAHGELYYTKSNGCSFVVPLGHMSGNSWWQFPPEDYLNRLETVLTTLRETADDGYRVPDELCKPREEPSDDSSALDDIAEGIGTVREFGRDS